MAVNNEKLGVIILAAGKGTRMQSSKPKVLHEIAGKTMLRHVLDVSYSLDPDKVVVITGFEAQSVQQIFAADTQVAWAIQEPQLGTGHAIQFAKKHFEGFQGAILVLYGDVPAIQVETLQRLITARREEQTTVHLLTAVVQNPQGYGRVVTSNQGRVIEIVEEKDATVEQQAVKLINTGIGVYDAGFLLEGVFQLDNNNQQSEYYLTDIVSMAVSQGATVGSLEVGDLTETIGVNDVEGLKTLEDMMKNR